MVASGLTGVLLLVLSDLAAREAFQPRQVPVGVVTGLLGGAFLAWLLTREWRKGTRMTDHEARLRTEPGAGRGAGCRPTR